MQAVINVKNSFFIKPFAYGIQFHAETEADMLSKWILEDDAFIQNSLGSFAPMIIKKQQKYYEAKSLISRIDFINTIYDLMQIKKKY